MGFCSSRRSRFTNIRVQMLIADSVLECFNFYSLKGKALLDQQCFFAGALGLVLRKLSISHGRGSHISRLIAAPLWNHEFPRDASPPSGEIFTFYHDLPVCGTLRAPSRRGFYGDNRLLPHCRQNSDLPRKNSILGKSYEFIAVSDFTANGIHYKLILICKILIKEIQVGHG